MSFDLVNFLKVHVNIRTQHPFREGHGQCQVSDSVPHLARVLFLPHSLEADGEKLLVV